MKKLLPLLLVLLAGYQVFAQSPQGMNYQAIVRNANGQPVTANTPVKLRFTIHDLTANGTAVYNETLNDTTNQFGLVEVVIGSSGNLSTVNWGNGAKFLQVETDVNNTGNFTDMGTTRLMSVPYALYAANSAMGPAGPTGPAGSNGTDGATGPTGPTGADGQPGATGAAGAQGVNGNDGVTGPTGPAGQPGTNGQNGIDGATGPTGPAGANGNDGATGPTGPAGQPGNDAAIPSGVIVMWSGALANIPAGWALCDGNNGTPNLLDRFIVSVPNAGTNPGATGGANTYSLTEAQLPPHSHTGSGTTSTDGAHTHTLPGYHLSGNGGNIPFYNWSNNTYAQNTNTTSSEGNHNHSFSFTTSQTGSGAPIDNRPAYYTLAFIIKL
jgi:microcystin-dependent protein